ncbi:MAG: carbohydrate ABC transporter permease [Thermoprotei archaeon]|nr:MAG: carbohydrate ABC transporter permease [Thermoprotei archaeon]
MRLTIYTIRRMLVYFILLFLAFLWIVPMYIMVITSLKTPAEISKMQYLNPPSSPRLQNYGEVMRKMAKALFDCLFISIVSTSACVFIGACAGYYLARFPSRATIPLTFMIMFASFLPYQMILIPLTTFESLLRLIDTHHGLIFAYIMLNLPLATLVSMTFFLTFPRELEEAAIIDGCDPLSTFLYIVLPASKATLLSTAILVFTSVWNEFLIALVIGGTNVKMIAPVVAELKGCYTALWNLQMAGSVIGSIPPLILFIAMGRYFIRGLLAGAMR